MTASATSAGFELSRESDKLAVSGVLSFETAAAALEAMQSAAVGETPIAELDLAGVSHCDSAGLACVLEIAAEIDRRGGSLKVSSMPEGMRALAQVCDVDHLLS